MSSQVNLLLEKFNKNDLDDRKYLLIFDIDGTLRPDEIESLDHRHPRIPPETALQLRDLNALSYIDIIILTARSYIDLFKSNFPKEIIKYCGCGKQILDNEILTYAREDFRRSYDETVIFIELIKDLIGKHLQSKVDYLITPGDFALYFNRDDYKAEKKEIMSKLDLFLAESTRWRISDFGKELIFHDNKYHYDKGNAAKDIMSDLDLETKVVHAFMFGDSAMDYKAMLGLRDYQKQNPSKRLKVNNISVGPKLIEKDLIDFRFDSYNDTIDFIEALHKVFIK